MANNKPLISFTIVSCNRLHYFKSCVETLLDSTIDYSNKELLIVDNASVEDGTQEYLNELEKRGFRVIRQTERNPSNEFATALNLAVSETQGEIVCPLQGDMQFVANISWLHDYAELFMKYGNTIGSVMLDAQRTKRNAQNVPYGRFSDDNLKNKFFIDTSRSPVNCAGDAMYSRALLNKIGPWKTTNLNHEGGNDSETDMLARVAAVMTAENPGWRCIVPAVPPAVGIFTDARGTMARVRGNRRYGDYWPPKSGNLYYEMVPYKELSNKERDVPVGIEQIAKPIGFNAPLDSWGHWLKNPIRPETANPDDYVELLPTVTSDTDSYHTNDPELAKWLES